MAPTSVPRFDSSASRSSPLAGTTYAAMADTPKATEPSRLATPIHQTSGFGAPSTTMRRAVTSASPLATRNATDPNASGRHTR